MTQNNLKFAALVRVSTETQEMHRESIPVQKQKIKECVFSMGGQVERWYSGQEHATPDSERANFDRLLEDASNCLFDAVMVTDLSRWSRDNIRNEQALRHLQAHGIRFFAGTTEYDLNNPESFLVLQFGAVIGQFHARQQSIKSILSRIERAKQNKPSVGKLPYGRTWDAVNGWDTIPREHKKLRAMAEDYLQNNIGFDALGAKWGMAGQTAWRRLCVTSGSVWEQHFCLKSAGIEEVVSTKVPPLLDDTTISAIKAKAQARRTYARGKQKNQYLFGRKIYSTVDGRALTGTTNANGTRSYRTYRKPSVGNFYVNADQIEYAVLSELGRVLADDKSFFQAVLDGHGSSEVHKEQLDKRKTITLKRKQNLELKFSRLVNAISEDIIGGPIAKRKAQELEAELKECRTELASINHDMENIPKQRDLERQRKYAFDQVTSRGPTVDDVRPSAVRSHLTSGLGFDQNIINAIYGGKDPHGKRFGVYITPHLDGPRRWYEFEAYGKLGTITGELYSRSLEPPAAQHQVGSFHTQVNSLRGKVRDNLALKYVHPHKTTFVRRARGR